MRHDRAPIVSLLYDERPEKEVEDESMKTISGPARIRDVDICVGWSSLCLLRK